MEYSIELLSPEILPELTKLIVNLFDEVDGAYGLELDPDWETYIEFQDDGELFLYTVRNDGELVGYAIYMLVPVLHHKGKVLAMPDSIYLLHEHRGGDVGRDLMLYIEKTIVTLGADYIAAVTKLEFDFGSMLKRNGYEEHERTFFKKLNLTEVQNVIGG